MSEQETRKLAERLIREVWSVDGDLDVADEVLAEDYVIHGQQENSPWPPTREGEKQQAAAFREALGIRSEVQDILVDGDKAAIHWRTTGTHKGEFLGMPPTGKTFTIHGVSLIRVREGKVVENRTIADQFSMMQQLGAMGPS